MASRLDTSKAQTGASKRDIDYVHEYQSYVKRLREARAEAEAKGVAFDATSALEQVHKEMNISQFYAFQRDRKIAF